MTLIVSIRMEEFAWRSSGCRRNAMRNLSINRSPILYVAWAALLALAACVSSIPSNFHYETSVRGERGLEGTFQRQALVTELLDKWGLKYFSKDWVRYQVILEADIKDDGADVKCREVSTETPVGAPTLKELLANDGMELQAELTKLISVCVDQVKDFP